MEGPTVTAEMYALGQGGLIDIGAHRVNHPLLSADSAVVQRDAIQRSKAQLQEILRYPLESFAYPHGDDAAETVAAVRDAGFVYADAGVADRVWRLTICVYLSGHLLAVVSVFIMSNGQTLPAS